MSFPVPEGIHVHPNLHIHIYTHRLYSHARTMRSYMSAVSWELLLSESGPWPFRKAEGLSIRSAEHV